MTLDDSIRVRVPETMSEAVKQAADHRFLSSSGYIRQALAEQLKRDGVDPSGQPKDTAGQR